MHRLPKVIAHRGASGYAPENTLAALEKAQALGVYWAEFDVMLTEDGVAIVIHDETLDRTTNGHGAVAQHTYAEIHALDAGGWFAQEFIGCKVPTFTAFLQTAARLAMSINVEIKPTPGQEQLTAQQVVKDLQSLWQPLTPARLIVSSFSVPSLIAARTMSAELPLGLLLNRWFRGWREVLLSLNCMAVHANYRILSKKRVAEIKAMGLNVLAYTVDNPIIAQKLFTWGVDTVFSNVPDVIS